MRNTITVTKEVEIEITTDDFEELTGRMSTEEIMDAICADADEVREWLDDDIGTALQRFTDSDILGYVVESISRDDILEAIGTDNSEVERLNAELEMVKKERDEAIELAASLNTDEHLITALNEKLNESPFFRKWLKAFIA